VCVDGESSDPVWAGSPFAQKSYILRSSKEDDELLRTSDEKMEETF